MTSFQGDEAQPALNTKVAELVEILSLMRPDGSRTEQAFVDKFIAPLGTKVDEYGNHYLRIGDSPIMWSCHTDTVHTWGGRTPLLLDDKGVLKIHPKSQANCLGADDGTGVWIMLNMVRAKVPGLYIFHRCEERGGKGSKFIADKNPGLVRGIKAAIAFDRKDTGSIITHQWGGRCCSEDFAKSLSTAIGLDMKSDSGGSFTDTASYTDLIGECTNISVGYKWQHGRSEEQDLPFAVLLLNQMLSFDATKLVFKRKPGEKEKRTYGNYRSRWAGGSNGDYWSDPKLCYKEGKTWSITEGGYVYSDMEWDDKRQEWVDPDKTKKKDMSDNGFEVRRRKVKVEKNSAGGTTTTYSPATEADTHLALVKDFPEEIAEMLREKGYGLAYLHQQIRKQGGKVETVYYKDGKPQGTAGHLN